jgi:multimeric flavodoxin WrbA
MPALQEMLLDCKAAIICSPINWNNMSARLKDFLDRLTCIQNVCLLGKPSLTMGKTLGILVNGHEDGALKTALDIYVYFQQMGYVMAPYGFGYGTHGAASRAEDDIDFFGIDKKLRGEIEGVVNNVVATMALDLGKKLSGKIKCVSE